jgi:hypothetical protein
MGVQGATLVGPTGPAGSAGGAGIQGVMRPVNVAP